MSRTIWKFPLDFNNPTIYLSPCAKILSAQMQGGTLCVWAEVNPNARQYAEQLHIFGTGHPMPDGGWEGEFISTVHLPDGLVFHIYRTVTP